MIDALDIGYAIKERRAQLGLTQAQVADAAGVSKRCLWSLELGQNSGVQFDKLTAVLESLGLDLRIVAGESPAFDGQEGKEDSGFVPNVPSGHSSSGEMSCGFDALAILTGGGK